MNTNSNLYIFLYATVLVIVVATLLSFTAIQLKDLQDTNVRVEKIQNILASVSIESTPGNAEKLYDEYITETLVINSEGEEQTGTKAFNIDMARAVRLPANERPLPMFKCNKDGNTYTIIPMRGKGLWGPVWGYLAFESDYNTIYGATFDHKGETPGLGADINQDWFEDPFIGKKIFNDKGEFVSITVHKGGKGAAKQAGDTEHGVDAISGGTITSKGLEDMIKDCLAPYETYFKNNKK